MKDLTSCFATIGALLFLAGGNEGLLDLVACSESLQLPIEPHFLRDKLVRRLETIQSPVTLAELLAPSMDPLCLADTYLLRLFQAARIELLLPLVSNQQSHLIGVVALGGKETDEAYSAQERIALAALARTAATAAENVLLFEQQQKQLALLQEERAYRIDLARYANAAQDEARKRISRDLHDSPMADLGALVQSLIQMREDMQAILAQCEDQILDYEKSEQPIQRPEVLALLSDITLKLEYLVGENTQLVGNRRINIEELVAQIQSTNHRMREICNDLHPTYLNSPLTRVVEGSVERFRKTYPNLQFTLQISGTEPSKLGDDAKVTSKEIMEQAINNAILHAEPTRLDISLRFAPDGTIQLSVTDNGNGFQPKAFSELRASGHHGLANMRERADLVGGELTITSSLGKGTSIALSIPPPPLINTIEAQAELVRL